jgi:cytochrome c peroxidase
MKTKAMDNTMKTHTMTAVMLFASMSAIGIKANAADQLAAKKKTTVKNAPVSGQQAAPSAAKTPSVLEGERLFRDPALGGLNNQKSCNTCHPSGKGLENAWKNPMIAEQVNKCIIANLKGKPLPLGSVEMQSLVLYMKSLKPAASPAPSGY